MRSHTTARWPNWTRGGAATGTLLILTALVCPGAADAQFAALGPGLYTDGDFTEGVAELTLGLPLPGPLIATAITSWGTSRTLLKPLVIPQIGVEAARVPWIFGVDLGAVWLPWTGDAPEPSVTVRVFRLGQDGSPWVFQALGSTILEEWSPGMVLKFTRILWRR